MSTGGSYGRIAPGTTNDRAGFCVKNYDRAKYLPENINAHVVAVAVCTAGPGAAETGEPQNPVDDSTSPSPEEQPAPDSEFVQPDEPTPSAPTSPAGTASPSPSTTVSPSVPESPAPTRAQQFVYFVSLCLCMQLLARFDHALHRCAFGRSVHGQLCCLIGHLLCTNLVARCLLSHALTAVAVTEANLLIT